MCIFTIFSSTPDKNEIPTATIEVVLCNEAIVSIGRCNRKSEIQDGGSETVNSVISTPTLDRYNGWIESRSCLVW